MMELFCQIKDHFTKITNMLYPEVKYDEINLAASRFLAIKQRIIKEITQGTHLKYYADNSFVSA